MKLKVFTGCWNQLGPKSERGLSQVVYFKPTTWLKPYSDFGHRTDLRRCKDTFPLWANRMLMQQNGNNKSVKRHQRLSNFFVLNKLATFDWNLMYYIAILKENAVTKYRQLPISISHCFWFDGYSTRIPVREKSNAGWGGNPASGTLSSYWLKRRSRDVRRWFSRYTADETFLTRQSKARPQPSRNFSASVNIARSHVTAWPVTNNLHVTKWAHSCQHGFPAVGIKELRLRLQTGRRCR